MYLSAAVAAAAKSLQSCPTLCDPIDGSPWGSPVPGILWARTLEWVAISFSSVSIYLSISKSLCCTSETVDSLLLSHHGSLFYIWNIITQLYVHKNKCIIKFKKILKNEQMTAVFRVKWNKYSWLHRTYCFSSKYILFFLKGIPWLFSG